MRAFVQRRIPFGFFTTRLPRNVAPTSPVRYFPCTVYSSEELSQQHYQRAREMEENFCQAGNLLYKMRNGHQLDQNDENTLNRIEAEYKRHRSDDLNALV